MRISLILYPSINSFQYRAVEKYHCFSCQVHQKRHDVIILYDNVACIQIVQYVYSRHRHNFFILHSFWICVYTLFFKNLQRKSFQITLIENTGRQFYLVMHSVLSGYTDHTRFMFLFRWDYRCAYYIQKNSWSLSFPPYVFNLYFPV